MLYVRLYIFYSHLNLNKIILNTLFSEAFNKHSGANKFLSVVFSKLVAKSKSPSFQTPFLFTYIEPTATLLWLVFTCKYKKNVFQSIFA